MIVRFDSSGALTAEIKEKVHAYLAAQDGSRLRRKMWTKTAIILLWAVASYAALVFWVSTWWQAAIVSTSLGLAMAGIGFAIQHDANHGSYPASAFWRRLLGFTLDVMGGSSYIWKFQHNVNHHSFTNIHDADADIDLGPIARLGPGQPHRSYYRFQHLYVWPLYGLLAVSWVVYADWRDFFSRRIGSNPFAAPKGTERTLFWLGKALWIVVWLVVPLSFQSTGTWLAALLWTYLVLGFTLSIVFQLAHIVEDAEFMIVDDAPARVKREFFYHQLATTVDFAPKSRWLTWYLGGLNYQVEHHLFPKVCHLHYPAIATIVEAVCRERGAPYYSFPTFRAALRSHARWLYTMGQPDEAPVAAALPTAAKTGALNPAAPG